MHGANSSCLCGNWRRPTSAQDRPARILYFTHSAGYRHDVIPTSRDILQQIGATAGFQITSVRGRRRLRDGELAALRRHNVLHYR